MLLFHVRKKAFEIRPLTCGYSRYKHRNDRPLRNRCIFQTLGISFQKHYTSVTTDPKGVSFRSAASSEIPQTLSLPPDRQGVVWIVDFALLHLYRIVSSLHAVCFQHPHLQKLANDRMHLRRCGSKIQNGLFGPQDAHRSERSGLHKTHPDIVTSPAGHIWFLLRKA